MLPKIKSKAFIRLLPQIFELREQGYSYEEVTAILEKEHGLILSVNQFSVYLARYKNATTSKVKKQVETSPAPKPHQESTKDPIKLDSNRKDYVVGSPEYKAAVQKETEEKYFNSPIRVGLGLKHP
jgi:intein-encoded DNA endonuclease-like protein